jgi:NTP pyrophosphatase (non-canonical NTP hydrolase)
MTYQELEPKVEQWAEDKGILAKATPLAQSKKTLEEVNELIEALEAQEQGLTVYTNSKGEIKNTAEEVADGIGDTIVTLIIQCKMQNLKFEDCLELAYNVIKNRTGKMQNGTFVKN